MDREQHMREENENMNIETNDAALDIMRITPAYN